MASKLGKRSREPLAEKSTNAKKAKSLDSHPGENQTKRSSRGKTRIIDDSTDEESLCEDLGDVGGEISRSGALTTENTAEDENPDEDFEDVGSGVFDQDVYDEDVEDVEDGDTVETAEGAARLREWFRHSDSDEGVRLAWLSSQEKDDRMEQCRARFSFILVALIETAQQISKADFDDAEKAKELPFGFPWRVFLLKMSLEKVLDMMMASLSNTAKVILGGSMDSEELLLLPSKWEGCKLWGVYTDIFKAARYCGSGTNKKGVASRMDMYPAIHNGTRKAEEGAHGDLLMREQPNLRLIAVFDPSATAKPYVLLMEQLLSILPQTLNVGTNHRFMRASTIAMIRRATPRDNDFESPRDNDFESPRDNDFESKEVRRLNNAAQCLQGLYYKRQGGTVCANENLGTIETAQWYSADPGVPFSRVICHTRYRYRKAHNGEERPARLAAKPKLVRRTYLREQAGAKANWKTPLFWVWLDKRYGRKLASSKGRSLQARTDCMGV